MVERQWRWLWTSGRTQPHLPPSPSMTPQLAQWSLFVSGVHLPGPHQESSAEDVLPAAAEEIQPANNSALLQSHHWIHLHLLHHHLVRCGHRKGQGQTGAFIWSAEKVIGCNLPSLQDLYTSRCLRRVGKIVADPSHPNHKLFETLPSSRRLRSIRTKTSRHKNSFFPSTTSLINKFWSPLWHWHSHSPHPDRHATLTYHLQTFFVTLSLYLFGTTSSCCISAHL